MELKRKIYDELLRWKETDAGETALFVEGARRVGKSTIVETFARNEYDAYLKLDFAIETEDIKQNFRENISNLDEFYRNLFAIKGKDLGKKKAVIIFDEVQLFPLARQSIKYLVADGRYDFIETGSLISVKINVKDILIPSEERRIKMYPLDFEEFLWATDNNVLMQTIRESYEKRKPLGDLIHRRAMKIFRTYMAVGGMPQAVVAYAEGGSFSDVDRRKQDIITLYESDLKKYDERESEKPSIIFKTIPRQLTAHGMHFRFSEIDKNARYKNYVDAVEFIDESMIGNICTNVSVPDVFMEQFAERDNFKLYMGDTGLLVSQMIKQKAESNDIYRALIYDKLVSNLGMLLENAVSQMLVASGHKLYFHEYRYSAETSQVEKKYEIDFLLVKGEKICPIEVKSSSYRSHKSFDYFVKKYPIKFGDRYIIYTKDFRSEDGITYIPVYMTECL